MRTQNLDFELVPHRVGVAYVSIRVNSQSTARSVVQEVLPLFGRQVCILSIPIQLWGHLPYGPGCSLSECPVGMREGSVLGLIYPRCCVG